MNKLSWLLYLSDVMQSLSVLLGIFGFGSLMIVVVGKSIGWLEDDKDISAWSKKHMKGFVSAALGAFLVCALLPSKNTVMTIAASEAAGMALQSPDGKEITNDALAAIKQWLKSQIKETK